MLQSLLAVSPDWNRATLPIVIHHRMNVLKCLAVLLLAWQAFTVIVLPAMGCCDGASACCTATRLSVSCAACAPAQGPMLLIRCHSELYLPVNAGKPAGLAMAPAGPMNVLIEFLSHSFSFGEFP
jgi:hypothetical protein